jgi:hypothetical protein
MGYQTTVDLVALKARAAKVRRLIRAVPNRMLRIGTFAARFERSTHAYQNRTGMLEASTMAIIKEGGDVVTLELLMGMNYASYVNDLGYSSIDEAAAMVEQELNAGFAAMAAELEG